MSETEIEEYQSEGENENMTAFDENIRKHYELLKRLQIQSELCEEEIERTEISKDHCHVHWDGILCWPKIPKSTTWHLPCPEYIEGFNLEGFATRRCTDQGQWYIKELGTNQTWTNYTMCLQHYVPHPDYKAFNETSLHANLKYIRLISNIGYSSSLITLITAFLILFLVKKLRCPRNKLHLHLFSSFMLRAWTILTRSLFFSQPNDKSITCKMFTCFWHYTIMVNYSWILMEGLYLHNLVFLAVFRDAGGIIPYVIMGWALPCLFLIPWTVIRILFEDEMCWITNRRTDIFWIIRGPITTSIVLNFLIFLNITRVLLMKMFLPQAPQMKRYKYRKWFKSTLVLVPLFGVHYTFTLGISLAAEFSPVVEIVWLYIDHMFSSFQGFLVALLYCFLNGEVRSELSRIWKKWKSQSDRFYSHTSLFTQSNTHISRTRGSVHSLQSNSDDVDHSKSYSQSYAVYIRAFERVNFRADSAFNREPEAKSHIQTARLTRRKRKLLLENVRKKSTSLCIVSVEKHEINPSPRHSACAGGPSQTIVNLIPNSSTLSPAVITTLAGVRSHNSSVRKPNLTSSSSNCVTEDSNSWTLASKDLSASNESGTLSVGKSDRQCLALPRNGQKRRRSFSTEEKTNIAMKDLKGRSNTLADPGIVRSKAWKSDVISPASSDSSVCL